MGDIEFFCGVIGIAPDEIDDELVGMLRRHFFVQVD
jgi:hypothetical protein